MIITFQRVCLALLACLFLFTLALGVRRVVLEAQYRKYGADLPFTLESALHYRRVKMVFDTGRLPERDAMIQYPDGVNPRTTYTVGAEYVYAALARCFPSRIPVADRIRWIEGAFFSLGVPILALGLYGWRRNVPAALAGALFYAVSISSVIRSTGQELSHENFAIPLLLVHWAAFVTAPEIRRRMGRWAIEAVSSAFLALALCNWDMIQFYVGAHWFYRLWRLVRRSGSDPAGITSAAWIEYAGLVLAGVLNPYHHAQGWLLSIPMGLAHAAVLLSITSRWIDRMAHRFHLSGSWARLMCVAVVLMLLCGGRAWAGPAGAYGHFAELLWAKLRYFNVKPDDPTRLTFNQRILWTPALHSTDWRSALQLFPALMALTFPAMALVFASTKYRHDARAGELVWIWSLSLVAFWLFSRFHVYLSLFSCIAIGYGMTLLGPARRWIRIGAGALVGIGLFAEAAHTLQQPGRWGRVNVYFKELNELTNWLQREAAPDPVLANFGVSGSIAAYGKCAVLLHPKFENETLRERVREYGETLFKGTEKEFRDWADAHGARYYVYAFGEFSREHPELQMRYFVNQLDPAPEAAARGFEFDPDGRTWFVPLWRNIKYAVYRVVGEGDERMADHYVTQAERAFEQGDLAATEQASILAIERFPRHQRALELLRMATTLKSSGFQGERR